MFLKNKLSPILVSGALLLSAYGGPIGLWFAISSSLMEADLMNASIAYNSQHQEYLVVWWGEAGWIWGQRVKSNGTLAGMPINTGEASGANQSMPDVAYNSQHDEYLVVWDNRDDSILSIRARRVAANGWLPDAAFTVACGSNPETYCTDPSVAYASTADRYLVIYVYGNLYGWGQHGIAGRAFASDGSPDGPAFDIRPYGGGSPITGLDLAYNRTRNEFLVVWSELVGSTFAILGRRVKMTGGAGTEGNIFTIANSAAWDDIFPVVAALPVPAGVGQYLVVWQIMFSPSDSDIYAQRVAGDGSGLVGPSIIISNPVVNQWAPAVDSSETNQQYLVVWRHNSNPPLMFTGIRGRAVSSAGDLLGQEEGIGGVVADYASVAAGPVGDFLVAYQDTPLGASFQGIFGRLWGIRTYLPLVKR